VAEAGEAVQMEVEILADLDDVQKKATASGSTYSPARMA